ncbi:hypothetical protein GCM10010207_69450 [Streptomyces atratus]|nr:hypothetical protein GCM10010207_69450 [Streptomyces atratus]
MDCEFTAEAEAEARPRVAQAPTTRVAARLALKAVMRLKGMALLSFRHRGEEQQASERSA